MDARSGDEELGACECEYAWECETDEPDLVEVGEVVTRLCLPPRPVRESLSEFSGVVSDCLDRMWPTLLCPSSVYSSVPTLLGVPGGGGRSGMVGRAWWGSR
jgi:hypothetical protein